MELELILVKCAKQMLSLFHRFIKQYRVTLGFYVAILCILTLERVAIPHFYGQLLETIKSEKFDSTFRISGVSSARYNTHVH